MLSTVRSYEATTRDEAQTMTPNDSAPRDQMERIESKLGRVATHLVKALADWRAGAADAETTS